FAGFEPTVSRRACAASPWTSRCSTYRARSLVRPVTDFSSAVRAASAPYMSRCIPSLGVEGVLRSPSRYAVTTTSLACAACATSAARSTAYRLVGVPSEPTTTRSYTVMLRGLPSGTMGDSCASSGGLTHSMATAPTAIRAPATMIALAPLLLRRWLKIQQKVNVLLTHG